MEKNEINKKYYSNIDGLRAFGCLAIIAWHVWINGNYVHEWGG